jgi:hypothetical protein
MGVFLNSYVLPMAGLSLMVYGAWSVWAVWSAAGPARLPLPARVVTVIVGCMGGWLMNSMAIPQDPLHVALGFPMPVLVLEKDAGASLSLGAMGSLPCALMNLAIGIGLAHAALRALWPRLVRLWPKPRPNVRVDWLVSRPAVRKGFGRHRAPAPLTHLRPRPIVRAAAPGREGLRTAIGQELDDHEQRERTA